MCTSTTPKQVRARKPHRCVWCWTRIDAGSTYLQNTTFADGSASRARWHPECYEASGRVAAEEGGCFEFISGEYARGEPAAATTTTHAQ